MTILTALPVRALNQRLSMLEDCARKAPPRTFARAKAAALVIDQASNDIREIFKEHGFKCPNDDRLRVVEAAIYGLLLANHEEELASAEGFGAAHCGPDPGLAVTNVIRDRDALERLGL